MADTALFGDIGANSTTPSLNTIRFRMTSGATFAPSMLSWTTQANGPTTQVSLADNGADPDVAAGDGNYSGLFTAPAAGDYVASSRASGTVNGAAFSRAATTQFTVRPATAAFAANGFSESAQTTAGGKLQQLTVTANVNVTVAGSYEFGLYLASGAQTVRATSVTSLSAGAQAVSAIFPAVMYIIPQSFTSFPFISHTP